MPNPEPPLLVLEVHSEPPDTNVSVAVNKASLDVSHPPHILDHKPIPSEIPAESLDPTHEDTCEHIGHSPTPSHSCAVPPRHVPRTASFHHWGAAVCRTRLKHLLRHSPSACCATASRQIGPVPPPPAAVKRLIATNLCDPVSLDLTLQPWRCHFGDHSVIPLKMYSESKTTTIFSPTLLCMSAYKTPSALHNSHSAFPLSALATSMEALGLAIPTQVGPRQRVMWKQPPIGGRMGHRVGTKLCPLCHWLENHEHVLPHCRLQRLCSIPPVRHLGWCSGRGAVLSRIGSFMESQPCSYRALKGWCSERTKAQWSLWREACFQAITPSLDGWEF